LTEVPGVLDLEDTLSRTKPFTFFLRTFDFKSGCFVMNSWFAVKLNGLVLVSLLIVFLSGCTPAINQSYVQSQTHDRVIIQADREVELLYRDLYEAQNSLGMEHQGGSLQGHLVPGRLKSRFVRWKGRYFESEDFKGVVLGISKPGEVTLYVTEGKYRRKTSIHEMKHQILYSHGIHGRKHHDIIWDMGD
jgi:hypothetical protein